MAGFTLGFIGFGEVAFHIAKGLTSAGLSGIQAFDVMTQDPKIGPLVRERANAAGVGLVDSLALLFSSCDTVLCATSAKYALAIGIEASQLLRPDTLYADLNSASPGTKIKLSRAIDEAGGCFVDAAVMELVPPHGHKVPMAVSGSGAKEFAGRLSPYGMKISFISEAAGASSSLKMMRSIFMKGLTALLLETLTAGRKAGVDAQIMESISGTLDSRPIAETARLLVTRTAIAAERRVAEMGEVLDTLEEMGLDASSSQATKAKLQWLADFNLRSEFGSTPPETVAAVLDAILDRSTPKL
ncbi:MAG: phosphogluconate dehydrogenase [Spirochaetes bacterium]|nr:MAG: phosphogluconate dehydrogenase [Spirochaetota bacterium]